MTSPIVVLYEEHTDPAFLRELLEEHARTDGFLSGEILREEQGKIFLLHSRWLGGAPKVHPEARGWRFVLFDEQIDDRAALN